MHETAIAVFPRMFMAYFPDIVYMDRVPGSAIASFQQNEDSPTILLNVNTASRLRNSRRGGRRGVRGKKSHAKTRRRRAERVGSYGVTLRP